jgi:hypothetical protein
MRGKRGYDNPEQSTNQRNEKAVGHKLPSNAPA